MLNNNKNLKQRKSGRDADMLASHGFQDSKAKYKEGPPPGTTKTVASNMYQLLAPYSLNPPSPLTLNA